MRIFEFKQNSNNPIAPSWCYFIGQNSVLPLDECDSIKSILLSEEKKIILETEDKIKNDAGTGLGLNSVTSRYVHYNILNWNYDFIEPLKGGISDTIYRYLDVCNFKRNEYYVQSWFNVLRKGQHISKHHHADHSDTFLGGHLTICTEETSTYYENPFTQQIFKVKNEPGILTLFPNWIKHWTDEYHGDCVRISIAMNITYKEAIDNIPNYPGKELTKYCILK